MTQPNWSARCAICHSPLSTRPEQPIFWWWWWSERKSVLIFLPLPEAPVQPDVYRFMWIWFVTKWLTWLFPPVRLSSIWTCSRLLATNTTKGHQGRTWHAIKRTFTLTVFTIRSSTKRNYKLATTRLSRSLIAWNHVLILHVNLSGKSVNGYTKDTLLRKRQLWSRLVMNAECLSSARLSPIVAQDSVCGKHQWEHPDKHVSIDSVKDFIELTQIKIKAGTTGLFMVGGGTPKNFVKTLLFARSRIRRADA